MYHLYLTDISLIVQTNWMLGWILSLFRGYSTYPTQLGVSDFAAIESTGPEIPPSDINFPWCLGLYPTITREDMATWKAKGAEDTYEVKRSANTFDDDGDDDEEHLLSHLQHIPEGSALYDIYCLPHPDAAHDSTGSSMQRIGRIITTSPCIRSARDQFLFFKHQRKEEDYELRPYWLQSIVQIHAETGAGFFDKAVPMKNYHDFEMA
jgi:hypothetical protein